MYTRVTLSHALATITGREGRPQPSVRPTGDRGPPEAQPEAAWSHLWPYRGSKRPPSRALGREVEGLSAVSLTRAPMVTILMPSAAQSMGPVEVGAAVSTFLAAVSDKVAGELQEPPGGACVTGQARQRQARTRGWRAHLAEEFPCQRAPADGVSAKMLASPPRKTRRAHL